MNASTELVPIRPAGLLPLAPFDGFVAYDRVPVVVDASALINDCLRFARLDREPLLLHLARQPQIVNLYATHAVREEVEKRLPRAAARSGLALDTAERFWRDRLRPLVSFVNVEGLQSSGDSRALRLEHRDASDVPTVALAELLGPCLVFAHDKDLVDLGIARDDWANLLLQARDVSTYQAGASLTVWGVILVGALGVSMGQAAMNAARRWPFPAFLVGAVGGFFLYSYWQSELGTGHRRDAHSFAALTGQELTAFLNRAFEARDLLERAAFVPERETTPLAGVARVVAAARQPLRPGEIAPRIGYSTQRVTSLLQAPVFNRTPEGYYLLGRRG